MKIYATKKFSFEAAHHLPNYEGKCHNLHGHSYHGEATVSRDVSSSYLGVPWLSSTNSMVIDFKELKKCIEEIISAYDHEDLNNHFDVPTAEVMVVEIFKQLNGKLNEYKFSGVRVESVKLWETEDSYVEYRGE